MICSQNALREIGCIPFTCCPKPCTQTADPTPLNPITRTRIQTPFRIQKMETPKMTPLLHRGHLIYGLNSSKGSLTGDYIGEYYGASQGGY